jgi:hypothetical protein
MRRMLSAALIASIGVLLLADCGYIKPYADIKGTAKKNSEAMRHITPGISPDAFLKIMKDSPYLVESYKGKEGEQILVYKYITRAATSYDALTGDDLTPFVFVNNVLDGWGWLHLETASRKYGFVAQAKIH